MYTTTHKANENGAHFMKLDWVFWALSNKKTKTKKKHCTVHNAHSCRRVVASSVFCTCTLFRSLSRSTYSNSLNIYLKTIYQNKKLTDIFPRYSSYVVVEVFVVIVGFLLGVVRPNICLYSLCSALTNLICRRQIQAQFFRFNFFCSVSFENKSPAHI